ncbi:hypothetical protein Tco_1301824 [Tanacetum coccineum]
MSKEERCNTTLGLGIRVELNREKQLKQKTRGFRLDLALSVHPKVEVTNHGDCDHKHDKDKDDQDSCSSITIDERVTNRSDSSNLDVYHDNSGGSRKKLKLGTEQITLLEDCFKIHSTLNTNKHISRTLLGNTRYNDPIVQRGTRGVLGAYDAVLLSRSN